MENYDIDIPACRRRQQRMLEAMQRLSVDLILLTHGPHIEWLTGARFGPQFAPAAAMTSDGRVALCGPERAAAMLNSAAADEVIGYPAKLHSTLRSDQRAASSAALMKYLKSPPSPARLGVEFSAFPPVLAEEFSAELVDIDPAVYQLRRRKEADELRRLRKAIAANGAMYQHARQIVKPGINELDLYSQLYAVAVRELGEPPTYFGQDFQCASRGGPPRNRVAQAGELYILDLGVGFRGYYSDNARTLAVDRHPTDEQLQAWAQVAAVFSMVEATIQPGVSCRQVFEQAQTMLDEALPWKFNHHLGHGVGLDPHEAPHLNPHWDDIFEVGDLIAVEPGLYHEDLRAGIRLEQNYLVTDEGVELLTDSPLDLA